MATIKAIDGRTVHQIQSGQVIVDLCSVVKELVENSVDAGATNLDIRFKNQGLDLIEVQDNGSGVSPDNYEALCLKHHTSKLSSYADIGSLETFGFRGEALSSLCAVSVMTVTTCLASQAPKGSKLTFKVSGELLDTNVVAAQRGTVVSIEKLFHSLPVRRRELERNIRREWQKVIALLNQYACILTGVKFSVSQHPTKGKRIVLFSTKGNHTTRDNIINIFGAKTMGALVPLKLTLELLPTKLNPALQVGIDIDSISKDVKIIGHVSRPVHGDGRQTPDRQMFFVNGRPCGLPQFAKVFNEVYRSYNSAQSPFILADIQLDTHMYDVNVSPDKRTILLHDQNHLLDTLRTSLVKLFDVQDYTVPASQLLKIQQKTTTATTTTGGQSCHEAEVDIGESEDDKEEEVDERGLGKMRQEFQLRSKNNHRISKTTATPSNSILDRWVKTNKSHVIDINHSPPSRTTKSMMKGSTSKDTGSAVDKPFWPPATQQLISSPPHSTPLEDNWKPRPVRDFNKRLTELGPSLSYSTTKESDEDRLEFSQSEEEGPIPTIQFVKGSKSSQNGNSSARHSPAKRYPPSSDIIIGDNGECSSQECHDSIPLRSRDAGIQRDESLLLDTISMGGASDGQSLSGSVVRSKVQRQDSISSAASKMITSDQVEYGFDELTQENSESNTLMPKKSNQLHASSCPIIIANDEPSLFVDGEDAESDELGEACSTELRPPQFPSRRKDATWNCMQHLSVEENIIRSGVFFRRQYILHGDQEKEILKGVEDITSPDAEAKLSLIIQKSDFCRMRVAGQFNLGFIIAVRPALQQDQQDELFIIDQHASDEKYNFERLQDITVLQSQRLVSPKILELTALEEEIVMSNMEAIEANGFKIDIDIDGGMPVGRRCQLTALPLSKETTFKMEDLEELISLLGDESSESAHIPRPSKVRKMFAMRACRSSVMIGKALTSAQMYCLVGHLGELDKPWNCPHGRPTMRHLCGLQTWNKMGWKGDIDD